LQNISGQGIGSFLRFLKTFQAALLQRPVPRRGGRPVHCFGGRSLCSPMGDGHFFCRGDAAFAHWGRSLLARGGHFFRKSLGPRKRIPVGRSLSGDGHFFDKFWGPRKWILRGGHFQGTVTFGGPLGPRKIDSVGRSLSGDGHFFDNLWGPGNAFLWDGHFQGTVTFLTVRTRHPGSRRVPPTDEFGQKEQCPFCDKLCDRGINTRAGGGGAAGGAHPCVCTVVGRTFRKPSQGTKNQLEPLAFA
jgi:hypothetical protein